MKKQFFIAAAFIAATSITGQLFAQDPSIAAKDQKIKTKSNIKNDRVIGTVSATASGCDISFDHEVKSPRDASSGLATGKRMHKPYRFSVSAADNAVTEISPAASAKGSSGGGHGKASLSDLSIMITIKGKSQKLAVEDGKFSLPEDCPDGECDMVISWSWGASNSGSSKKSYAACHFALSIEDGACMAINTKGTAATNH